MVVVVVAVVVVLWSWFDIEIPGSQDEINGSEETGVGGGSGTLKGINLSRVVVVVMIGIRYKDSRLPKRDQRVGMRCLEDDQER